MKKVRPFPAKKKQPEEAPVSSGKTKFSTTKLLPDTAADFDKEALKYGFADSRVMQMWIDKGWFSKEEYDKNQKKAKK